MRKFRELGLVSMVTFPRYIRDSYLSAKILIDHVSVSDVLIDKDEVAMALEIPITFPDDNDMDSGSENENSVSESHIEVILQNVSKILFGTRLSVLFMPENRV